MRWPVWSSSYIVLYNQNNILYCTDTPPYSPWRRAFFAPVKNLQVVFKRNSKSTAQEQWGIQKPSLKWEIGKKLAACSRKKKKIHLLTIYGCDRSDFSWLSVSPVTLIWLFHVVHTLGSIFLFKNEAVHEAGFPKHLQFYLVISHPQMNIFNYELLAK